MECFVGNAANVLVANDIDIAFVVLDDQDVFAEENMVWDGNGVGHILCHIHAESFKWDGVKKLLDLFSHNLDSSRSWTVRQPPQG